MTRIDPISSGIPAGQLSWTIIRRSTTALAGMMGLWCTQDVWRAQRSESGWKRCSRCRNHPVRPPLPWPPLPSPPPYENDIRDSIQQTAAPITQLKQAFVSLSNLVETSARKCKNLATNCNKQSGRGSTSFPGSSLYLDPANEGRGCLW